MSDNLIGATTAIFIVSLSIAVNEPVDVAWSTRDGTAKAGTDYKAANGVVSFLPGETRKQIEVTVYGQNVSPTGDKNFFINLMPPTNAVLGTTLIEAVIKVEDESGVPVTSVIVAQGKRGLKGDPGLSAYEQAVLMGYDGTLEDWMQEQADAAAAAQRASDYAANAAAAAQKAEYAATAASFLGNIFPTPEAGVDPVTGVGNGAYYNVRSPSDDAFLEEYQNIGGVPTPTGKSYPSSVYVENLGTSVEVTQALAKTGLNYFDPMFVESNNGYPLNAEIKLNNGQVVRSLIANNTNDPNEDMTGWVNQELDQKIRNGQIINLVSDFKAVGGTDCSTQIRAAILEALRTGKALYVPSTTAPYLYAKNQLTFKIGVDVNDISPNACLFIYGDGQASQFKMLDGQIDQLYSSSFRFEISRNMGTFYFKDFFVDNNARGSAPPPEESKYIYEQSHTFSFAGGIGTTLDNITYENMIVKDPAADAFNNSYRGVCGTIRHINPSVRDRTRVRADIQEGFGAKNIIVSNPLVHSIEAEATIAPTGGSTFIQVNGGTCEVLDIAGNSETDNLAVEINNLRVTGYTNLGLIKKLTVNGGQLRLNKNSPRFPYLKDALFNKVRVLHPYDPVTGAVTSIGYLRRPTCAGTIEWIEPEHVIDYEGALPVAPVGELITNSGGTSIVSADVGLYNLIIRRAKFDPRIPKSIYAYRMGTVVLDNNKYGGTDCAIDWYATSGSATDLTVIGGDYSKVTGTALKIGGVSEGHKLTLTGDNWTGAKASSWKLLSGSLSTYAPAIYNYRKLTVDALPTIALAKDVFQLGNIASAVGSVIEYQCTASSLTAPTYVCSKQLGLYAAATASLPVLTASEKWARAHDTTTNTIKTWTGSAWI